MWELDKWFCESNVIHQGNNLRLPVAQTLINFLCINGTIEYFPRSFVILKPLFLQMLSSTFHPHIRWKENAGLFFTLMSKQLREFLDEMSYSWTFLISVLCHSNKLFLINTFKFFLHQKITSSINLQTTPLTFHKIRIPLKVTPTF
jgi:hypothetical protein